MWRQTAYKGSRQARGEHFAGYSGTVFEPDDQYKGDFARSYFYMAARYNDRIAGWNSDMLARNDYPCFTSWAMNLLLKWHRQDPVSQKELNPQRCGICLSEQPQSVYRLSRTGRIHMGRQN